MVHSAAYASNEWKAEGDRWLRSHGDGADYANADGQTGEPWNLPTSETLAPGDSRTFALKFLLAPEIRDDDLRARSREPQGDGRYPIPRRSPEPPC